MNNAVDKVKLNEIPGILEKIKKEIDSAHLLPW